MNTGDNEQPAMRTDRARPIDVSVIPLATVRSPAEFSQCLDQLRRLAGPLSHRELESRSGGRLRRTKIGQVLGGELPRREFLEAYLEVCQVSEEASRAWLLVWTQLVTSVSKPNPSRSPRVQADDVQVLRRKRDLVLTQLRTLQSECDAANRRAQQATDAYEVAVRRLVATERARDEALQARDEAHRHVRQLDDELGTVTLELSMARQEIADLREQLDAHTAANSPRRLTRYTRAEANTLYGPPDQVPPPVLGEHSSRPT